MLFSQINDFCEYLRVAHSQISQNLSVQLDLRKLKAMNQLAISNAPHPASRIEANNPQPAEHPLADSAIPESVYAGTD
jgi:hypothetical protein